MKHAFRIHPPREPQWIIVACDRLQGITTLRIMKKNSAPAVAAGSHRSAPRGFARVWSTAKQAAKEFIADDPMSQAATIAYYTIFSLPAVMIITVMVAANFYDEAEVRRALITQAGGLIGHGTADDLQGMLENARVTDTRFFAKMLGLVALAVSASAVFASLQNALNRVWKVKAEPGRAVLKYLSTRLISLALVASFGFLMLVSLVLDTVLVAFGERLGRWLSGYASTLIATLNVALSFCIIGLIFAMVFKVLPDARIRWKDVWRGALVTTLLFSLGKYLISTYIALSDVGDAYGAAGAIIIILVWVYYSTVIMLFGAHFTHVDTRDHGSGVVPSAHAKKQTGVPSGARTRPQKLEP